MYPKITYSDLSALSELKKTRESLGQYLVIVKELMKNLYPNYPYTLDFDIDNQKYVCIQKGSDFNIETGFYWDLDLYFGMKIIVPNEIVDIDQMPFDNTWSYGVEGNLFSYFDLYRYSDIMVIGCPSQEYIDVLHKFKEITEASTEVVRIAEKYTIIK